MKKSNETLSAETVLIITVSQLNYINKMFQDLCTSKKTEKLKFIHWLITVILAAVNS